MKFLPTFNGRLSACLLAATVLGGNTLAQTPFATGPQSNLLRVMVQIQAPENSKYAWLNYNLFVGVAGQSVPGPDRTAVLRVYRVL